MLGILNGTDEKYLHKCDEVQLNGCSRAQTKIVNNALLGIMARQIIALLSGIPQK